MLLRQRQLQTRINALFDAALFGSMFWLAHFVRSLPQLDKQAMIGPFSQYQWLLLVVVPLTPPLLELQGFYRRPLLASRRQTLAQILRASAWMSLAIIVAMFVTKQEVARGVVSLFLPIVVVAMEVKEELVRLWARSRLGDRSARRRVILLGGDRELERLGNALKLNAIGDVEVVARLDPTKSRIEELADLLHEHAANSVLVAPRQILFGQIEKIVQVCELEGVEVWMHADFFQTRLSQTTVDELAGHPMLVFRTGPEQTWQSLAKGVVDFGGSVMLLLLSLPVMLLAAVAVKVSSPGPVLFRQRRAGLNGHPFMMLKFRTMVTNAEQLKQELAALNEMSGPVFKVTNDPRVTAVGRFLRKWSVDELPQLWNVFRGEMSLVGPRPLPVDEVARFDDLAHRRRLSVKPGLTCLWQVSGRNNVTDFKEWVRLDLEYIDNWSLWLDFRILFRTIPAVFTGAGAK
jgi:exopolysaccharide biosynthesis polyprenyl glycosylphosphotransferase